DAVQPRAADITHVVRPEGTTPEEIQSRVDVREHFNLPSQRRAGAPGAGGFAGAADLALFYQRLVSPQESASHAPLRPETIAMATAVHTRPDQADGALPANRGL